MKERILEAYFVLRLPVIYLLKCLFAAPAGKPDNVSRILVVRLDRLGDLVLSLPLLASLKAAYPEAKIDLCIRPYLTDIARMIGDVSDVIVYKGMLDSFRRLPERRYDAAIDMLCDYSIRPALVALSSKAPVRIGFRGGFRELLFTHPVDGRFGKGMVELDLELLKPLKVPAVTTLPRLNIESIAHEDCPTIVIHPGAHYDSQRWEPEKFAAVARMASEKYGIGIVVVGAPEDKEAVDRVMRYIGNKNAKAAFPDMKELVRLLAGSRLLVCNNSGPLHLAAALGVPTVSVMGPTDPVLWRPNGADQIVIRKDLECSPCSQGRCRDHRCLGLITADEVFDKVRYIMEERYGIRG